MPKPPNSKAKAGKHASKPVTLHLPGRTDNQTLPAARALEMAGQFAQQGQWPVSVALLSQLVAQLPQFTKAWYLLFDGLQQAGDYPGLEQAARRCLELSPRNVAALLALASAQRLQQQHQNALENLDKAIKLEPANASAHNHRGVTLKELGEFDAALESFNRSIRLAPKSGLAYWNRADLFTRVSAGDIQDMETTLAASASPAHRARLHYALARAHEFAGQPAAQIAHIEAGAALKRSLLNYDHAAEMQQIDDIIEHFDTLSAPTEDGCTDPHQPIFICGLPRSGTTLVEHILSSHPEVVAGDELNALPRATAAQLRARGIDQPFPRWRSAFTECDWRAIGDRYRELTRPLQKKRYFTDKNLQNYKAIGLILEALPQAKIIFCQRHPMDNLWACYRQYFADGLRFSYSQTELADTYHGAMRLHRHWQQLAPGRVLSLQYEDLVADQLGKTRQLLDYLELPWNEACLQFHHNPRAVRTTSASQVRQPLNSGRINQWQAFSAALAPMRTRLAELGAWPEGNESPQQR